MRSRPPTPDEFCFPDHFGASDAIKRRNFLETGGAPLRHFRDPKIKGARPKSATTTTIRFCNIQKFSLRIFKRLLKHESGGRSRAPATTTIIIYYKETATFNNHYVLWTVDAVGKVKLPPSWGELGASSLSACCASHSQLSRPMMSRHPISWNYDDVRYKRGAKFSTMLQGNGKRNEKVPTSIK